MNFSLKSKALKSATFLFIMLICVVTGFSQNWQVTETKEGIEIKESGKKVIFYQVAEKSKDGKYTRANYVHPLYGLNGEVLTEDFPEDHFHHRGIFWTWHQVWIGEKRIGDAWLCENFSWDVQKAKTKQNKDGSISITANVFWKSPLWLDKKGEQRPLLKEDIKITAYPDKNNTRIIDFEIELNALGEKLYIGGSEDEKGYGGFSVRVFMPENIKFTSTTGEVTPQKLAVEAGDWMNVTGTYMNNNPKSGIIIMNHKSNPEMPQEWILRAKRSMQNPVFPGNEKYEIKKDEPVVLKYRLVLHDGISLKEIEEIYMGY